MICQVQNSTLLAITSEEQMSFIKMDPQPTCCWKLVFFQVRWGPYLAGDYVWIWDNPDSNYDNNCINLASYVNYLGLKSGCEQKMC